MSVSAISASLGLALVEKVLLIARGGREKLDQLREAAKAGAERLADHADEDVAAFNEYMACRRMEKSEERERAMGAAMARAIEVPLKIVREAGAGLDLCAEAARFVHAAIAADLGAAILLLVGAVRATLLSIDSNLWQVPRESELYREAVAERDEMKQTLQRSEALLREIVDRT